MNFEITEEQKDLLNQLLNNSTIQGKDAEKVVDLKAALNGLNQS